MLRKLIAGLCLAALLACPADALTGTRRVLLSGNVAWTPLSLGPLLAAWWDAQYTPSLTFNASNVSGWADRINGIAASQATGANQPGYSATARNGKAGLTFNGTTQFMAFGVNAFLPTGTNPSFIATAAFVNAGAAFNATFGYGASSATNTRLIQKNNANTAAVSMFGTDLTDGTWSNIDAFIEGQFSSASMSGWDDGTAFGPIVAAFNTTVSSGNIGSIPGPANGFNGTIQQVVVLNNVPSTCQRQKLEGWESWYDGKAGVNLPVGHPYKNSAPLAGGAC